MAAMLMVFPITALPAMFMTIPCHKMLTTVDEVSGVDVMLGMNNINMPIRHSCERLTQQKAGKQQ